MKRIIPLLIFFLLVGAVAYFSCHMTCAFCRRPPTDHAAAHARVHAQLGLDAAQKAQLTQIEQRFDKEERHCNELIAAANRELAKAILEDRDDSPRVKAAVAKIHETQGALQHATLQHIFEMKPALKPAQYDKLLQMTASALTEGEHCH